MEDGDRTPIPATAAVELYHGDKTSIKMTPKYLSNIKYDVKFITKELYGYKLINLVIFKEEVQTNE